VSRYVATVLHSTGTEDVRVFQVDNPHEPDTFYWCCDDCGACSKHLPTIDDAVSSGVQHEHTKEYKESHG
jgi:hypothetical protein